MDSDNVVSGLANPDSWETDPEATKILASAMGDKEIKAVPKESGDVEYLPIEEIDRYRFVVGNDRALEIAKSILVHWRLLPKEIWIQVHRYRICDRSIGTLYFVQAIPKQYFYFFKPFCHGIPQKEQLRIYR